MSLIEILLSIYVLLMVFTVAWRVRCDTKMLAYHEQSETWEKIANGLQENLSKIKILLHEERKLKSKYANELTTLKLKTPLVRPATKSNDK